MIYYIITAGISLLVGGIIGAFAGYCTARTTYQKEADYWISRAVFWEKRASQKEPDEPDGGEAATAPEYKRMVKGVGR